MAMLRRAKESEHLNGSRKTFDMGDHAASSACGEMLGSFEIAASSIRATIWKPIPTLLEPNSTR